MEDNKLILIDEDVTDYEGIVVNMYEKHLVTISSEFDMTGDVYTAQIGMQVQYLLLM